MLKDSNLFINPNGVLCYTVTLFNRALFTKINVVPKFVGYDVNGNIINVNDFQYKTNNI